MIFGHKTRQQLAQYVLRTALNHTTRWKDHVYQLIKSIYLLFGYFNYFNKRREKTE